MHLLRTVQLPTTIHDPLLNHTCRYSWSLCVTLGPNVPPLAVVYSNSTRYSGSSSVSLRAYHTLALALPCTTRQTVSYWGKRDFCGEGGELVTGLIKEKGREARVPRGMGRLAD